MKGPRDKGFSPNQRFDGDAKPNAIHLTSGETIRIVCDYDKVIKVRNTMIRIQDLANDDPTGLMFYTIPDNELAYKWTRYGVRVRMVKKDPSYIYLFEPQTDTYLGCVARDLESAGDAANVTDADLERRGKFCERKNSLVKYRKNALQEVEDGIANENEKFEMDALPDALAGSYGVVIPEERKKLDKESSSEDGVGEPLSQNSSAQDNAAPSELQPDIEVVEDETIPDISLEELEHQLNLETV